MSVSMSRVTGSPVGSFRTNRSPGIGDAVRSLLSLLWIEIRRGQGVWLLPLMVGLGLYMNGSTDPEGVVLWPDLSTSTMQSYVIVGPLAAALAAWIVDRDRRCRMRGLVRTMSENPYRRDIVLLATATFWGLAGYGLVAIWYGFQGFMKATWGGPDLALIATGALGIVILAGVGFIVGRLVRGTFSPIVAVVLTAFLSSAPKLIQDWSGKASGPASDLAIRPLAPSGLIPNIGPGIFTRLPSGYLPAALLWLTGAVAVVLATIALMRGWRRNWTAWAALVISCAVALFGADRVMGYDGGYESMTTDALRIPFTWSCETPTAVEVCVHPAYEATLAESAWQINAFVAPIVGLPGVPTRWEQNSPLERSAAGTFSPGTYFSVGGDIGGDVFAAARGRESFTASQHVILGWLSRRVDPGAPLLGLYGQPSDLGIDALELYEREITAAVDRFAALSPEAQRAWLEANWDALRAGQLSLEDLP